MDPELTKALLTGAAGGLAPALVKHSVNWLIELVRSHSPACQEQATENLKNFVTRLAARVERLEADLSADHRPIFEEAMGHPSSSLLIQKALVAGAVTDNDDRHELLAELIAQRLTADADDMIALAGSAACDVVSSLTSRQIKLLGMIVRVYSIGPLTPPVDAPAEVQLQFLREWWNPMTTLCRGLEEVVELDFEHLEGLSCLSITRIASKDHKVWLFGRLNLKNIKFQQDVFTRMDWWPVFDRLWKSHISKSTPTTVGKLIGILHHDSKTGQRTTIKW